MAIVLESIMYPVSQTLTLPSPPPPSHSALPPPLFSPPPPPITPPIIPPRSYLSCHSLFHFWSMIFLIWFGILIYMSQSVTVSQSQWTQSQWTQSQWTQSQCGMNVAAILLFSQKQSGNTSVLSYSCRWTIFLWSGSSGSSTNEYTACNLELW